MKYFFDNCLSYRFARMLAALEEFEVVALRGSDYVFVTCDDRQQIGKLTHPARLVR